MSSRRLIIFAVKFSRSPYLDNHISEGIQGYFFNFVKHVFPVVKYL